MVAETSLLQLCNSVAPGQQCDNCATVWQDCHKYFESVRVCANRTYFGIVFACNVFCDKMCIIVHMGLKRPRKLTGEPWQNVTRDPLK